MEGRCPAFGSQDHLRTERQKLPQNHNSRKLREKVRGPLSWTYPEKSGPVSWISRFVLMSPALPMRPLPPEMLYENSMVHVATGYGVQSFIYEKRLSDLEDDEQVQSHPAEGQVVPCFRDWGWPTMDKSRSSASLED
ncbi:hypothetical protein TruAng_008608 [Truncatella angustata]|nr:hypothetical protein TruAng_008608 [Truncatella angustata]